MILAGWKQIAKHLGYGIRTVQRWERQGLPVKRVGNGPRSPVVADSEKLDAWILRTQVVPSGAPPDVRKNLERALELQRQIANNAKKLQRTLEVMAEFTNLLRRERK